VLCCVVLCCVVLCCVVLCCVVLCCVVLCCVVLCLPLIYAPGGFALVLRVAFQNPRVRLRRDGGGFDAFFGLAAITGGVR